MASNWTTYKVGDLFYLQNGFAFKGTDFIDEGVPVIKIKNVKAGNILLNDLSYVSRDVADKAKRFLIKPNDILITMSGNRMDGSPETWVGKVALFQEEGEFLLNQRVGILRPKEGINVNVDFCAYALSSWEYQNHFIMAANSSGGQANISPDLIYDTKISLPGIETQNEVASILKTIDEKIRNNREINQLNETLAQSIFQNWFIDRIKNGEVQVENLGRLSDLIHLNPRLNLKKGAKATYVEMKNLSEVSSSVKSHFKREFSGGSKFQNGDVLLARITPCLENGKTGLVDFLNTNEIGWGSTEFIVMRGKENVSSIFVYCLSRHEPFRKFAIQSMVGSSGRQRVVESVLSEFEMHIPSVQDIVEFDEILSPLFKQIKFNEDEINVLQSLKKSLSLKLLAPENID